MWIDISVSVCIVERVVQGEQIRIGADFVDVQRVPNSGRVLACVMQCDCVFIGV